MSRGRTPRNLLSMVVEFGDKAARQAKTSEVEHIRDTQQILGELGESLSMAPPSQPPV